VLHEWGPMNRSVIRKKHTVPSGMFLRNMPDGTVSGRQRQTGGGSGKAVMGRYRCVLLKQGLVPQE